MTRFSRRIPLAGQRGPAFVLAAAALLTGCAGAGAIPATSVAPAETGHPVMSAGPGASRAPVASLDPQMTDEPAPSGRPAASGDPGPSADPAAVALSGKPWATAMLTDVSTGERFTIASLAGRPVFVEAMAIWCTNCRAQQARFTEALAKLPAGAVEYVVLTVDPSETARDLARYEAGRGFTGRYVVAGRDVSAALESEFGANVLNPPSVPLVFIAPSGEVGFTTGAESVEEILAKAGG